MKFQKFFLFLVLFFVTLAPIHAQQNAKIIAGIAVDKLKPYDTFIQSEIEHHKISGAVSLVMRDGVVVRNKVFGYRDIDKKVPMKTDDLFYIQSMTKPIITVAFMMLFEEGHFLLNDPLSKYLPEFKNMRVIKNIEDGIHGETETLNTEITIAQLLSHTAGLTHGISGDKFDNEWIKEVFAKPWNNIKERTLSFTSLPMIGQPGIQWHYSAAPDILSTLIEKFSGKTTNEFLQERIFKPLGMNNTAYNLTEEQIARVVKVYNIESDGRFVLAPNQPIAKGNTVWSGMNGLFSTPADYLKFCQMLMNNGSWNGKQYLSRKTVELMTKNHVGDLFIKINKDKQGEGFGYGFAVLEDVAKSNNLGSNGLFYWSGAFNTHFFIDPKEKLIALFFTQSNPHDSFYHMKMRQYVYQSIVD
jgi:CubicO group peptidase (beta-lactamase class C family)